MKFSRPNICRVVGWLAFGFGATAISVGVCSFLAPPRGATGLYDLTPTYDAGPVDTPDSPLGVYSTESSWTATEYTAIGYLRQAYFQVDAQRFSKTHAWGGSFEQYSVAKTKSG